MSTRYRTMLPDPAMSEPAILAKLQDVTRTTNGWGARCPAHEDATWPGEVALLRRDDLGRGGYTRESVAKPPPKEPASRPEKSRRSTLEGWAA
jgi:hypothetical protein